MVCGAVGVVLPVAAKVPVFLAGASDIGTIEGPALL